MNTCHKPNDKPDFDVGGYIERFRTMEKWATEACAFAAQLDWLGDAKQHPQGSEKRRLADARDRLDFAWHRCFGTLAAINRLRAETTHCEDLLVDMVDRTMGDGPEALRLMERFHALFGDESNSDGETPPETFPDMFARDTYLRVCALTGLAEQFPKHIRHSARQMDGWPMLVSQGVDPTPEFHRLAHFLDIAADSADPKTSQGVEP
jgi:hypothetical protein